MKKTHGDLMSVMLVLCALTSCLKPTACTYLSYPRIYFAGQHRADAGTRNNDHCDYRMDKPVSDVTNEAEWGKNGTQEFELFNNTVTSVVYENGETSTNDSIVGHSIIGNLQRPFAKFVDLDVDVQLHSTIYGLQFGITWNENNPSAEENISFHGDWTKNIMTQNLWTPLKCYNQDHHGDELYQSSLSYGSQSTTVITGVDWNNMGDSQALKELKAKSLASADGKLSVRITQVYYTRNYHPYRPFNATLGYVYGVIGVPSPNDAVSIPGPRAMANTNNIPVGLKQTFNKPDDLCDGVVDLAKYGPWMNIAPFEVDTERNEIHVDLSNSIPSDLSNNLRYIGDLRLGYVTSFNDTEQCVYLLGADDGIIPYNATTERLRNTSGIYTIKVHTAEMNAIIKNNVEFVFVQVVDGPGGSSKICGEGIFSTGNGVHTAQILLQENKYYVRPKDYYQAYLDKYQNKTATIQLYVSQQGKPVPGVTIRVKPWNQFEGSLSVLPLNGVIPELYEIKSDQLGLVSFKFFINSSIIIPSPRQYGAPVCDDNSTTIPIDGQVYCFSFCAVNINECVDSDIIIKTRAFSDYVIPDIPTWVDDIDPILKVFVRMAPIMNAILNMSNYTAVTQLHNINLLNYSLSLGFDDVSYMPVTRDLSPAMRDTILKWLFQENPPRYDNSATPTIPKDLPVCNLPKQITPKPHPPYPRCVDGKMLRFDEEPDKADTYFKGIYDPAFSQKALFVRSQYGSKIPGRPLFEYYKSSVSANSTHPRLICTVDNLKVQLQTAIELEWATIPTYVTPLYSNGEGCNPEVYELIRSIIMQEMLHMVQSANILIALNESPVIDSKRVAPNFPGHLPGHVLPGLEVTLERLSIRHVHDVLMAIEMPAEFFATDPPINDTYAYTIGRFYGEIEDCINELDQRGEISFNTSTDRQVKWPWTPSAQQGNVILVDSVNAAIEGIHMITSQGEGASKFDPVDIANNSLAHFFKFEEIVCQRRIKKINDSHYSYSGPPIPLNDSGVWNMRKNPNATYIPSHSNCYTYSKTFHDTYRAFLRKLQRVFNGYPDEVMDSVKLMESLLIHAKSLMWTKFNPDDPDDTTTCGPVWDYEWPEEKPSKAGSEEKPSKAGSEEKPSKAGSEEKPSKAGSEEKPSKAGSQALVGSYVPMFLLAIVGCYIL